MLKTKHIHLNLASHPLRNRRLFFLILSTLLLALLFVSAFAGKIFVEYRMKTQDVKSSIRNIDSLINDAQRAEKRLSARVNGVIEEQQGRIDLVNSVILMKSFSWLDFLDDLERALPDSSYIVSLAPALTEDLRLQLRLKVVSADVAELVKLIENFKALKFDIFLESEANDERGFLVSYISLSYEIGA